MLDLRTLSVHSTCSTPSVGKLTAHFIATVTRCLDYLPSHTMIVYFAIQ